MFERLGCGLGLRTLRRYAIEHGSAKVVIGQRWDCRVGVIGSGIGLGGGSEDSGMRPREIDVHP